MPPRAAQKPAGPAASPRSPEQASVVLIYGDDEYRVARHAKELLQGWCPPDQQDLGAEIIDGAVETVDEAVGAIQKVLDALATVGLFGGAKVVWLREARFFSESVPGKFEAVKAAVARLAEEIKRGLLPGQRLLISADKVHRSYAFFKACQAAGAVVAYEMPERPRELMDHALATLQERFKQEGIRASTPVLQMLVDKAGYDTRLLVQEVGKLATYLGDRKELTADDIRLMVAPGRESASWDLAEALGQRDLPGALRLFRQLLFQKEKPFVLLMGIEGRLRDMLALRELMAAGYLRLSQSGSYVNAVWAETPDAREAAQNLVPHLLKGHPYRLTVLAKAASGFAAAELQRWYRRTVETHARLTEGGLPDDVLVECLLVDLIQGGRHAAG